MSDRAPATWRKEFGVDERTPPNFFSCKEQLTPAIPQAHALRRAFDLLDLDGIFCAQNVPLIYFKEVQNITPALVYRLHSQFWNHGGAPILVLVSADRIHVYSGMSRPVPARQSAQQHPSLVVTLERVAQGLREFLTSIESGDFFRKYAASFDPAHRIDRDLLKNLKDARDILDEITQRQIAPQTLDALLCRLVFTCYLFDRGVIGKSYLEDLGLTGLTHLRDVLSLQPARDAKAALYQLFRQLGDNFNGDLFCDDLDVESRQITLRHIQVLNDFFHGTLVHNRQMSFWPYDFAAIPIETISAIYEHFLKVADQKVGAFYTPRFLAEFVLDTALDKFGTLIGKRYLDPACGSGIFLVALFNRMAEEWRHANPTARNDRRARELMHLLQSSLFGVDISPTACRITAFSLYLAYLDQLSPRDIQELQARGRALPRLVVPAGQPDRKGNIQCADFFQEGHTIPTNVDLVIGNPPWGSIAADGTLPSVWCKAHLKPLPDKQIAAAFVWKAAMHSAGNGRICLVLPHGTLFNHSDKAVEFQRAWITQHTIRRVLNLADFRWFLFEKAVHPAVVVSYENKTPTACTGIIEYWSPKADWTTTQAEVISVSPSDRSTVAITALMSDLAGPDAPQTWKQKFWGTPRDLRLLDRLSLLPRLRDQIRSSREKSEKPWVMAEGFQPNGPNDNAAQARVLQLPSKRFIEATSADIDLFLLPDDCDNLKSASVTVRTRSNKNTEIFRAPHVLITKGFHRIAYSDFDVSFRHAVRGIHGKNEHREILMFLAAYLRTPLAKYFMFHTSSSWGMYRPEGHVEEVLRLPMPLPAQISDPVRANAIIKKVAGIVEKCTAQAAKTFIGRAEAIAGASEEIEPLVYEYFDIQPLEKVLITDTISVIIPSVQPTYARMPVPTVEPARAEQREAYTRRVCATLNGWAKGSNFVRGSAIASEKSGVGVAVLEKCQRGKAVSDSGDAPDRFIEALSRLRRIASAADNTIGIERGLMIFEKNKLFVVKPLARRYWTETAALNDADEIANTILMHSATGKV
jgi:hypothetical protein